MRKAEDLAIQFDATEIDDFIVACRIVQLQLLMGNSDEIEEANMKANYSSLKSRWQENSFLPIFKLVNEIYDLTQAWALMFKNQFEQAIPILESSYQYSIEMHLDDYSIQYAVLLSIALYKNKEKDKAMQYIKAALHMAKPEMQFQVFLEQGGRYPRPAL